MPTFVFNTLPPGTLGEPGPPFLAETTAKHQRLQGVYNYYLESNEVEKKNKRLAELEEMIIDPIERIPAVKDAMLALKIVSRMSRPLRLGLGLRDLVLLLGGSGREFPPSFHASVEPRSGLVSTPNLAGAIPFHLPRCLCRHPVATGSLSWRALLAQALENEVNARKFRERYASTINQQLQHVERQLERIKGMGKLMTKGVQTDFVELWSRNHGRPGSAGSSPRPSGSPPARAESPEDWVGRYLHVIQVRVRRRAERC